MKKTTQPTSKKTNETISLNPLNFEDALENLLKIRPVENKELSKTKSKENSKLKTKK